MGNAPDQVKQIAEDITLSNNKYGVSEELKKFILSEIEFFNFSKKTLKRFQCGDIIGL